MGSVSWSADIDIAPELMTELAATSFLTLRAVMEDSTVSPKARIEAAKVSLEAVGLLGRGSGVAAPPPALPPLTPDALRAVLLASLPKEVSDADA